MRGAGLGDLELSPSSCPWKVDDMGATVEAGRPFRRLLVAEVGWIQVVTEREDVLELSGVTSGREG